MPDTIVLVHGFWVTPRSWEHWVARYESQGTITEVVEFGSKPHLLPAAPGWEEIADYALAWALRHATTPPPIVPAPAAPAEPIAV